MKSQESSNQIKKIEIIFGKSGSAKDPEWNFGEINTSLTLAMGDHSRDCFKLANDISRFNGIPRNKAETYPETKSDALIFGMSNLMNGGNDVYFWTNKTRLKGAILKHGFWPAIFEHISHEMIHCTRALLTKFLLKDKGQDWWKIRHWPSIGDDPKKDQINEQAFAFAHGEAIQQIINDFLKMFKQNSA